MMTTVGRLLAGAALAAMAAADARPASSWTDRGEYDLALLIRAEASPEKRLALLEQWKAKYPASAQQQVRRELVLAVHQAMGAWPRMLETAREMVAAQPGNPVGLYWLAVLAPEAKEPTPAFLDEAEQAARRLLAGPAGAADPEWRKRRAEVQRAAERTLIWVAWQRGANDEAERQLTERLQANPGDAEMAAWLAAVVARSKDPGKQIAALWHLARAASLEAQGAPAGKPRREFSAELERIYAAYHGSPEGLDQLRAAAAAGGPFPPAGFQVESAAAAAIRRQDEELTRTNPELAAWLRIRRQLESPDGEKYLNESLRPAPLPKLRGVLVRGTPERRPQQLVLSMADAGGEEVLLKLDQPFPSAAPAGTALEFEGAAVESFTREPFCLTVITARDSLQGWPARSRR